MENKRFDIIIAGAGASGLTLAYLLKGLEDTQKSVLLIDRDSKTTNDRTWCFWQKEQNLFEELVFQSWPKLEISTPEWSEKYEIDPYVYKMIRGIDFYEFIKKEIEGSDIIWVKEEIISISENGVVNTNNSIYEADYVFDSTFDPDSLNKEKANTLLQHFYGKIIETPEPVFKVDTATYMDFQVDQEGDCRFGYILPFSNSKALVEYTLFNKELLAKDVYQQKLDQYIADLGIQEYHVLEEEFGIIPMSDHNFELKRSNHVYNIGIKGGFAKASTGYTFLRSQKILQKMVSNLNQNKPLDDNLPFQSRRFKSYDATLLDVLSSGKYTGADVFGNLFRKNGIHPMLKFLDEETSLKEELSIMSSTPILDFGRSFVKKLIR